MRQPANAMDHMSHMVLSGQSSASTQALDTSDRPKPAAAAKSRPVRIRCKQPSKQRGTEHGSERMVMSGDLGSQVGFSVSHNMSACCSHEHAEL